MSHWLSGAQLIEACGAVGLDDEVTLLETAMTIAANGLAVELGIKSSGVTEGESAFEPATEGQECPDEIIDYDESSDWAEATRELES